MIIQEIISYPLPNIFIPEVITDQKTKYDVCHCWFFRDTLMNYIFRFCCALAHLMFLLNILYKLLELWYVPLVSYSLFYPHILAVIYRFLLIKHELLTSDPGQYFLTRVIFDYKKWLCWVCDKDVLTFVWSEAMILCLAELFWVCFVPINCNLIVVNVAPISAHVKNASNVLTVEDFFI